MKLYGYWRSSATWRVRIALGYKEVPFEYIPVHLVRSGGEQHLEAYKQQNPMEQVPLLELERDGQTVRLAQSLPMIEYLEESFPTPSLLPADPYLRARARQLAEIVNAGIQPLQNLSVLQRLKRDHGIDEQAWSRHWITRGLAALEATAASTAGRFLVGDAVSVADVFLVPQLYNARRFGLNIEPYPLLTRVDAACGELPAFHAAHADRQPDREDG